MNPADNPLNDDFWKEGDARVLLEHGNVRGDIEAIRAAAPENSVVFSSSGSTGAPKLTVIPRDALLASARAVNDWFGFGPRDIFLTALPLHHVGGFGVVARARVAGALVHAVSGKWVPEAFARTCADRSATVTSLVPTQVFDLVNGGVRAPASLEVVIIGGGGLDCSLATSARELGWPVRRSFGMTEASSQVATEHRHKRSPFGGAWLPLLPHWQARLTSGGLLQLRGPALFSGRLAPMKDSWAFQPVALDDGWYLSSDYAECREDDKGRVWIRPRGRSDDSVKIRGELISLGSAQCELEGIARGSGADPHAFAIIDLPDKRAGSRLVLVFESHASNNAGRVRELFNLRAPAFAHIDEIIETNTLPRSPLGKLRRQALRDLASTHLPGTTEPD